MNFLETANNMEFELVLWIILIVCVLPVVVIAMIAFTKLAIKNHKNKKILKNSNAPEVKLQKGKKESKGSQNYLSYFGSEDNICSISKNLTRVTIEVKDLEMVDLEGLKKEGVGVLITGNVIKCSSQAFADQIENN